jgi:hypothetical protein
MKAAPSLYVYRVLLLQFHLNTLQVQNSGTGGVADVVGYLDDGQAQYAYIRVEVTNEWVRWALDGRFS